MEDILQSIKRIIEDDSDTDSKSAAPAAPAKPAAPAAVIPPADVLELTQVIKEDGSVAPITPLPSASAPKEAPKPAVAPAPEPPKAPVVESPAPPAPPARPPEHPPLKLEEALVSEQTTQAALAALKPIVEGGHKDYSIPHIPSSALRNGNTVEDLVLEALKPMLKGWLDEHLPLIVQKIVEKEVKRIVTFHQD